MIEIIQIKTGKKQYLPLLLDADPSEKMVDRYLEQGEMFLLTVNGVPACEAVVIKISDEKCELKNIATAKDYRQNGYAAQMIRFLFQHYSMCYKTMLVGTSESMAPYYQKQGFQASHVVHNFFTNHYPKPIFEDGKQCVDMIYLRKDF